MLRIHFLQHWFNLSDPAAEEALHDSRALRQFVGSDPGPERTPDETTICKFRHLIEKHNPGEQLFHLVTEYLQDNGMKLSRGTIVGAIVIRAPSSSKKKERSRNRNKSRVRSRVEHQFGIIKRQFGFSKVTLSMG